MYVYHNTGRLPITGLPNRDLTDAEFDKAVRQYAIDNGFKPAAARQAILAGAVFVHVPDETQEQPKHD